MYYRFNLFDACQRFFSSIVLEKRIKLQEEPEVKKNFIMGDEVNELQILRERYARIALDEKVDEARIAEEPGARVTLEEDLGEGIEPDRSVVAPSGERAELGRADETYWLQYSNEILRTVRSFIESVQGKVISVQYEKETNVPQFITAEVSAGNYNTLLEKLGQIGELQKPLPSVTVEGEEPLQLRIKLISSRK